MGSTIAPLGDLYKSTDIVGDSKQQLTFIQFVPGTVTNVVAGNDSEKYGGVNERIGSIKALPHIGNKGIKKASMLGEESRYYPLLRGINDVPAIGDPVLLCTIGNQQYYLGPLNTQANPNYNDDQFGNSQITTDGELRFSGDANGYNTNFIRSPFNRMEKHKKIKLDSPLDYDSGIFKPNDLPGDMLFEGRHGNSIRIGSRNINPYIIMSNGRDFFQKQESSLDGSIFGMFKQGQIRNHFDSDLPPEGLSEEIADAVENQTTVPIELYKFKLADEDVPVDRSDEVLRSISKTFKSSVGRGKGHHKTTGKNPSPNGTGEDDGDIENTIYGYKGNQSFLSSDRITFNARKESMFLASRQFIHMGAGDSVTITANNTCLLKAAKEVIIEDTPLVEIYADGEVFIDGRNKITLGNPSKDDYINSAVMGESLVTYLTTIVQEIKNMCYATGMSIEQSNKPGAAMDNMKKVAEGFDEILGMELIEDDQTQTSYEWPKTLADVILSKKVFIKK